MTVSATAERDDVGNLASYSIPEAAHYLRIPTSTLRSWVIGQPYPRKVDRGFFEPPIEIADRERRLLSFTNLVEAHVLWAIRRKYNLPLQKVRRALRFLSEKLDSLHPLATQRFETDGVDLFIPKLDALITVTQEGQLAMREMLAVHLKRVEWSPRGEPTRLYPFTRKDATDEPRAVVIDPRVGYGRPVLVGTGIPTAIIAERFWAGEQPEDLARDYQRNPSEILEAIRCEFDSEAA